MPKAKDPDMLAFEQALLRSVDQALAGEGRATTPEQIKGRRGRPPVAQPKEPVTLRLDPEALAQWRATGKGWQTRAAKVLADWAAAHAPAH